MDVKAILLIGPGAETDAPESMGGVPMALLDVLGRPLLHRIADRLYRYGVSGIAVIGDPGQQGARFLRRALRADLQWTQTPVEGQWRAAQRAFSDFAQAGADLVLVARIGPYLELDIEQLVQFHLDQNGRVTAVMDAAGEPLGTFVLSASRRNDAAFMLRHELQEFRTPAVRYAFTGYCNRLAGAADLRRLVVDAFSGHANLRPAGTEIKPGVWVCRGARVHRGARIVAPAFIGEQCKVRASAVVTRCSALEHHVQVDCGTVVEDATVLSYTTLGAGLDVAHSVVGFRRVAHLRRLVEVEISDPKLVGVVSAAPVRALGQAAALAGFVPLNFLRSMFFGRRSSAETACLPEAVQSPSAALKATESLPATDPALSNFR